MYQSDSACWAASFWQYLSRSRKQYHIRQGGTRRTCVENRQVEEKITEDPASM